MSLDEKIVPLNQPNNKKKSYSVLEVQNILGVSRQTVYKLIKQNCFNAVKTETGYRILKESFDFWLDNE